VLRRDKDKHAGNAGVTICMILSSLAYRMSPRNFLGFASHKIHTGVVTAHVGISGGREIKSFVTRTEM
jgi:hypothetical protein